MQEAISKLCQMITSRPSLYPCGASRGMISISPEGDIYPCQRFVGIQQFRMGNVMEGIDESAREKFLADHLYAWEKHCHTCWAKFLCSGGCYSVNYVKTGSCYRYADCATRRKFIECIMGLYAEAAHFVEEQKNGYQTAVQI